MADKQVNETHPGFPFFSAQGILEETKIEVDDQADLTVKASLATVPAAAFGPGPFSVVVTANQVTGGGNTVTVLGGNFPLTNMNSGTTKEAHWLVTAGATPDAYQIEIEAQLQAPGGAAIGVPLTILIDVPEQAP